MKKWIGIGVAVSLLLMFSLGLADTEITANGTAAIYSEPDIVIVYANESVQAQTVGEAQEKLSRDIQQVTENLVQLGIDKEDIVTQYFNYYQVYNYEGEIPVLTGYQANHSLMITCRDKHLLDELVNVITESGMTEINNIRYDISNRHELYLEALKKAVEAADEKAKVLAQAGGITLDGIKEIRENYSGDSVAYVNEEVTMDDMDIGAKRAASIATGIMSGNIGVEASVTVIYQAK